MKSFNLKCLFGRRVYQYLAAMSSSLSILSSEMHFGWTSPSLPHLTKGTYYFQITDDEASWLAVVLLAGTIMGALIAGKITDVIGRKKVILMTVVPLLAGWLMIGFARDVKLLFAARFVAGISSGLSFSTIPMYLGEIAEPQIRGQLVSICPVCVVFGILVISILGNFLSIDTAAFISSLFPILLFSTFAWMPESPTFLLQKNRPDEAKATLTILRGEDEGQKEFDRLVTALKAQSDVKHSILDLFRDRVNRKAAFIAYGLRTIQQFCGATALTFYCKTIFEETDDLIAASVSSIIYFSIQLVVAVVAIFVVDILGRKPLLIASMVGTVATLFILSLYTFINAHGNVDMGPWKFVPLLALFGNVTCMSMGIRNVPLLMMGELFSPAIKPVAVGFGTIYYSIIAILSVKMFFVTNDMYGLSMPCFLYGMFTMLSLVFVIFLIPETKGLTLEEIQGKLGRKTDACTP